MAERAFSHYELSLTAGPGRTCVDVDVIYIDIYDDQIGSYGESLIGFATTWKDIAGAIRTGMKKLGLDLDPVKNISPMVDLT
jgi:hypothetical protein